MCSVCLNNEKRPINDKFLHLFLVQAPKIVGVLVLCFHSISILRWNQWEFILRSSIHCTNRCSTKRVKVDWIELNWPTWGSQDLRRCELRPTFNPNWFTFCSIYAHKSYYLSLGNMRDHRVTVNDTSTAGGE